MLSEVGASDNGVLVIDNGTCFMVAALSSWLWIIGQMAKKPRNRKPPKRIATGRKSQAGRQGAVAARPVVTMPASSYSPVESAYNPKFCAVVIAQGELGKSETQMALACNVTRATLRRWAKDPTKPEFVAAVSLAHDLSRMWWENTGQENLKQFGFQSGLYNKIISCRFRKDYGDQVDVNHGSDPDRPVVTKIVREIIRTPET